MGVFLAPQMLFTTTKYRNPNKRRWRRPFTVLAAGADGIPSFLPKQLENIEDTSARRFATRIRRVPVSINDYSIMSSCVKPLVQNQANPMVLLHGFDSGDTHIRYLRRLGNYSIESFHKLWKSYIKRSMVLVGASLGAVAAIDFAVTYPEAVSLLKSVPLHLYVNSLAFSGLSYKTVFDWMNISRLHCLYPWWDDATLDFMISGGYNVISQIKKVKQKTLIIWGEDDKIVSYKFAVRLHAELPNAKLRQVPDSGHFPHVQQASSVSKLITQFVRKNCYQEVELEYVSKHKDRDLLPYLSSGE